MLRYQLNLQDKVKQSEGLSYDFKTYYFDQVGLVVSIFWLKLWHRCNRPPCLIRAVITGSDRLHPHPPSPEERSKVMSAISVLKQLKWKLCSSSRCQGSCQPSWHPSTSDLSHCQAIQPMWKQLLSSCFTYKQDYTGIGRKSQTFKGKVETCCTGSTTYLMPICFSHFGIYTYWIASGSSMKRIKFGKIQPILNAQDQA